LIGCVVVGYQVWRRSQLLPLPAAGDIQALAFGFNSGITRARWHALPLSTGTQLVDFFRDCVPEPPRKLPDGVIGDPNLNYDYSLCIVDTRGTEYCFCFRLNSNDIWVQGSWAKHLIYVFPANKIPRLKKLVTGVLSAIGTDKGEEGPL
jgi:hypothetical protein